MADSTDLALDAYNKANPKVQVLILAEAEKRVQTNIGRLDALNSRLSSLCALLFAGAAVAANFVTNFDKVPAPAIITAGIAAAVFAVAGAIGCWGLFSGQSVFPGEAPSWWATHGLDVLAALEEEVAKAWLIERHEQMILSLAKAVRRRARAFNRAVVLGAIAGMLISGAALSAVVLGPVVKDTASGWAANIVYPD